MGVNTSRNQASGKRRSLRYTLRIFIVGIFIISCMSSGHAVEVYPKFCGELLEMHWARMMYAGSDAIPGVEVVNPWRTKFAELNGSVVVIMTGPRLWGMTADPVDIQVTCTTTGVLVTATIVGAEDSPPAGASSTSSAPWRPRIDVELMPNHKQISFEGKWIKRLADGTVVTSPAYPVVATTVQSPDARP
jgi:hypothetical protein